MKEVDLELYRWHWYQTRIQDIIKEFRDKGIDNRTFWSDHGTFMSVLPRQAGKTTMLIQMAKILQAKEEGFLIITPNRAMSDDISRRSPEIHPARIRSNPGAMVSAYHLGEALDKKHLLIDEYQFFHEQALNSMLNEDWKSVSMVGTLKVRAT